MGARAKSPFVILSTQRSGSTLLISLLDQHPELICAGEIFKIKDSNEILHPELSFDYEHKQKSIFYSLLPGLLITKHLNRFKQSSVMGFKLMISQLEGIPKLEKQVLRSAKRIYVLRRRDVLRQSLSLAIARAENQWVNSGSESSKSVCLNLDSLSRSLRYNERCDQRLATFAKANNCPELFYSDLARNPLGVAQELFADLGVAGDFSPDVEMKKTSRRSYSERIENYNEVAEFFANKGYQEMPK